MRRYTLILLLLACAHTLAGCTSSLPRPSSNATGTSVLAPAARIDAVPASLIVVPIDPAWVLSLDQVATGVLDDGRTLNVRFWRVNIDAVAQFEGEGPRRSSWLPTPAIWSASPLDAPRDASASRTSTPVMGIEFPATPGGRYLDIAGKRWAVNWVPSPHDAIATRTQDAQDESLAIWRPTLPPAGAVSPVFAAYSRPESLSPIGRWRYRMLTDGLAPPGSGVPNPLPPFDDPIIEAIARQNESRWQAALAMLWSVDADLAWRIKSRLTGVMDFGDGVVVPAWPTEHAILDLLLADLLDPALSPVQRARRANEWLEAQPTALAWVVDDAGIIDARAALGVATVAVANLGERPTLAWAEAEGERRNPDLHPSAPGTVLRLPVVPVEEGRPGQAPALVVTHLSTWRQELRVFTRPWPLTPPGLTIGPLVPDLTLNTWLGKSGARELPQNWASVARMHSPPTAGKGAREFELYVENHGVLGSEGSSRETDDVVRVWLGPTSAPVAVLRVSAKGTLVDELASIQESHPILISRTSVGWSFHLSIPQAAIEPDGLLRIAVTRTDSRGFRSTWPRAMLPWQREPGRITVDLTAWSDDGREP